ncbi:MAG: bifunctional [glutamate--ammonia ligase]-adenylyl-L-tyrosine phosphorylase/[glutamate--ammonia-ligase] adenylyltransferase [Halieaceae bacterium]|jgi:glutamate-ammonia-ligase adenylyltransferase|nr:bifunctional [glutamate--ammonia ligase]-adenylyl-L-tyrosine phosphorylase/[glutamate--ammonia-ligase] adenylyltransferase [Halieaceae bacterium]
MTIVSALPAELEAVAQRAWQAILEHASEAETEALLALREARDGDGAARWQQLQRVLACSRFAAESFARRPWLIAALITGGELERPLHEGELDTALADLLAVDSDAATVLRRFRQRQMLRIIWRDLNRLVPTVETMRDVSWLAEACIRCGLAHCMEQLVAKHGTPVGRHSGAPQELIVLAMGKLGGGELNLSSDIDLIFAYPEAGETQGARRSLSNEEFFTRLGRALIALLDTVSAEGFVFRVDMRLRPYGESGALAHSFAALEAYYQEQGRDWERYALIKARPVTGSAQAVAVLEDCLRPFVYRRYVDFSAIDSLRAMKRMIVAEVRRRGLENNVKLGAGGIREIEFIAQCFQLIRGGRDLVLQQRELLPVLDHCLHLGCLPAEDVNELRAAYLFLRDVEHAIQAWADRQSQELPADELPRAALAHSMGCADYAEFTAVLDAHRRRVSKHFDRLIEDPEERGVDVGVATLCNEECDAADLSALGFADGERLASRVRELYAARRVQRLQAEGRERLDRFMPLLLSACAEAAHPDAALERALPLVSAVVRRSAYLVLLIENPPALADLANLCGASPWIAEQLTRHPALLDELLDRASLYSAPERDSLQAELRQQTSRLALDDLEGHMLALRYFKAAQVLRVAASELAGRLPLMKVSDKLTFIAEVCLEQVLALAWGQLVARHGEPARSSVDTGFAIIAYGKLGGIELSYASDLDLVFIYDAEPRGSTDGERCIDNATFYTRLGQRIIHILEARMTFGQLYEPDMRLRPSGASGMIVSSFDAFSRYQAQDAWTWEHQALVRARPVAGDAQLGKRFDALRRDILCRERDVPQLAVEVVRMRRRMREHAGVQAGDDEIDLKQGHGGIVDIEFMVQYAVLAWSHREPALADWSDNVRILETLARTGLQSQERCRSLNDAYLDLRSATHSLALQQRERTVPAAPFARPRRAVQAAWEALLGEAEKRADEVGGDDPLSASDGPQRWPH